MLKYYFPKLAQGCFFCAEKTSLFNGCTNLPKLYLVINHTVKIIDSKALHWNWEPAGSNRNLVGMGGANVAAGGGGRSKNKQWVLGSLAG